MNERERAGIAANVNVIRVAAIPNPKPADAMKAIQAGLNLLETFLLDIHEIAEAHRPQVMLKEVEPELNEERIRAAFAAAGIPNHPAHVTIADILPEGYTQKLAEELRKLCAAETEAKFFDAVTDNIPTILIALDAYNPPSPDTVKLADDLTELCISEKEHQFVGMIADNFETIVASLRAFKKPARPPSLMDTPKDGTKPFRAFASGGYVPGPPDLKTGTHAGAGPTDQSGKYRTPENGA